MIRLIQDVRQSGFYDRPLPAVLAEMGFDPDDTDSFFLSENFEEIWPSFKQKIVSSKPEDSWFVRNRRTGFWYEVRRCFNLH